MSLIERIAERLGWFTDYYIVCEWLDGKDKHISSGVYKVIPWLSASNYNYVKERVAAGCGYDKKRTVITLIVKL